MTRVPTSPRWQGLWPELGLALVVLAIVATLLLPVSPGVLDVLLSVNLGGSALVLLVALQSEAPVSVSSLPSVLLVSTLYRLALDVAAARLILGRGEAGAVIRTLGHALMAGSLVVGGVAFAMISLVQYLVIARGASRVAEVAARFALDALPGGQMAIDVELREGTLDAAEALRRRRVLLRESQFYGAMDGALRFVRGDAVAGLAIVAIDLVGGITVGVFQHGMTPATAIARYGLLTVGQGLVAQVPALLTAVAAGVVVTRVSDASTPGLGHEVVAQFAMRPRALWLTAGLLAVLAVSPGMPSGVFSVLAAVCAVAAWRVGQATESMTDPVDATVNPAQRITALGVTLGRAHTVVPGAVDRMEIALREEAARLGEGMGVVFPVPRITVGDDDGERVTVSVYEVPMVTEEIVPGESALAAVTALVVRTLRLHAGSYVGIPEVRGLLDRLERDHPALVRELVPQPVSLGMLTAVVRALVSEGVRVRNLRGILESLASAASTGQRDPAVLTESVRATLQRELTWQHAPSGEILAYVLSPEIEDAIRDAAGRGTTGPLYDAGLAEDVRTAFRSVLRPGDAERVVVLASGDVRRWVRAMLVTVVNSITVLAYGELDPAVRVTPMGRIVP